MGSVLNLGFFILPMLLLLCVGNILGGIFIPILGNIATLPPLTTFGLIFTPSSVFLLCCNVISMTVLLTFRGPYLRLGAERSALAEQNNDAKVSTV